MQLHFLSTFSFFIWSICIGTGICSAFVKHCVCVGALSIHKTVVLKGLGEGVGFFEQDSCVTETIAACEITSINNSPTATAKQQNSPYTC